MEIVYNLSGAVSIRMEEQVYSWWVNGYDARGGYVHNARAEYTKKHEGSEERAHQLAREWCQKIGVGTYVRSMFTDTSYLFTLTTFDINGGVVAEHTENWES